MPYTRGQMSDFASSAIKALVSLRSQKPVESEKQNLRYVSKNSVPSYNASDARFMTHWTNWYHAFLSEVSEEFPGTSIAQRRSIATSRWVNFTVKNFRCPEGQVQAWLRTADQKALVVA